MDCSDRLCLCTVFKLDGILERTASSRFHSSTTEGVYISETFLPITMDHSASIYPSAQNQETSPCNWTEQGKNIPCNSTSMATKPSPLDLFIMILFVVTAIVTVIGNIVVVIIFLRCRRLRTATNSFLVNVAFADLLTGCASVPLSLVTYTVPSESRSDTTCLWSITLMMLTIGLSVSFLLWANLDRFIAIHLPFKYSKIFGRKTVVALTIGSWIFFSAFSFLPAAGLHAADIGADCDLMIVVHPAICPIVITTYSGMMIVLVVMNIKIYCTARRHSRCIRIQASFSHRLHNKHLATTATTALSSASGSQESMENRGGHTGTHSLLTPPSRATRLKRNSRSLTSLLSLVTSNQSGSASGLGSPNRSAHQNGKMHNFRLSDPKPRMDFVPNWKALKVVTVVVITYTMCHFPTALIMALQYVAKMQERDFRVYHEPFVLAIALTYLNSAMNPFIYYRIIPQFRCQVKRMLCCRKKLGDQDAYSNSYRRQTLEDIGP